jgi:hypothetical protein
MTLRTNAAAGRFRSRSFFARSRRWKELLARPVPAALRGSIKELGRRLFALGGTALMGQVCDRVAEMGGSWDKRMTILDARWDWIGNESERWMA